MDCWAPAKRASATVELSGHKSEVLGDVEARPGLYLENYLVMDGCGREDTDLWHID